MYAITAVAVLFASMLASVQFERLREYASAELRRHISDRVMGAPLKQLEEVGSANVQAAFSEHVENVSQFFLNVPVLLTNAVIVLGCMTYLAALSPKIFLVTLPFVALGSLAYHLVNVRAMGHLRAGAEEQVGAEERAVAHRR